jgi:hypothetical protein
MNSKRGIKVAVILTGALISATALADLVTADDHIVQGSSCIGLDCVNNESFGFDTIRLRENNLRIRFDDTSKDGFPANDWQLTANDAPTGGVNKFSIDDLTGSKTPFTVEAGAPTNSLYVTDRGDVGFGTLQPGLDLHVARTNTPALRFEQTAAGGFTAQTWDVAGNEANFFIRDLTGGSRLPFRIRPGAPTSSIDIAASGFVGIGTASPLKPLVVANAEATLRLAGKKTWDIAVDKDTGNLSVGPELSKPFGIGFDASPGLVMIGMGTDAAGKRRVDINGQLVVHEPRPTPDYVFEPGYELMSIDEHAAAMQRDKHLPHVQPAKSKDGITQVDVGARQQEMLEELEIAHLYIATLNQRLAKLEATVERLEKHK